MLEQYYLYAKEILLIIYIIYIEKMSLPAELLIKILSIDKKVLYNNPENCYKTLYILY